MRTHHIRTSQTQISLMGGLLAVLYMLFVLPCSAWGQDINLKDFLPLEVGNYWEYQLDEPNPKMPHYYTVRVEGDTLIDGVLHWIELVRAFDVEKNLTCVQRNARQIDDEGVEIRNVILSTTQIEPPFCGQNWRPSISRAIGELQIYPSPNQFVDIGMERVPVRAKAELDEGFGGPGATGASFHQFFGLGIGIYYHYNRTAGITESNRFRYLLFYAEVGGNTYGINAVSTSSEGELPFLENTSIDLYPNPFRDRFSLQMNNRGVHSTLTYYLFDMLGRLVQSGSIPNDVDRFEIELPGNASGVYMIRVLEGEKTLHKGAVVRQR